MAARSNELQIQIAKLTDSNKKADEKIAQYEAELAELRKTNEKLEMENRDAVNLEFEFERHKNKSKLRETELLEALSEKEKEVVKLEKSLNSITAERLQNTKEELLQKSLNEGEADENGKVCIKCEDLQRLLEDNKKVILEFEKLTLEYKSLKLNYTEIEKENETNKLKIIELEKLQEKDRLETEKLLEDIQKLREKLQNVQQDFEQLSAKNSSKNEECMALSNQVQLAREEMVLLEEKFKNLETTWQEQQQTLSDIESQYANIQTKYVQLQSQYDQLEDSKGQSVADCQRLEKENVELQTEIEDLKRKVQNAQHKLLECNEKFEVSNEKCLSETSKIQEENDELKKRLLEIQTNFDDLQKEYDILSNQLMDILQESESLKNENTKIQERINDYEIKNEEIYKAEAEINESKSQLEKVLSSERKQISRTPSPCRTCSMRSSGVCVTGDDDEELEHDSEDMLKKFCSLSESITEIELEHTKGKTKIFKSIPMNSTPNYKMYLKNILGVEKSQKKFDMEIENLQLQGTFKPHSFHIVKLSDGERDCDNIDNNDYDDPVKYIEKLKREIIDLQVCNDHERLKNKSMLESTERAFVEMREQIEQLSAQLLEKSVFVENCACKTYQKQIEALEKEKADISIMCEELQGKVNCTLNNSLDNLTNSTTGNEFKNLDVEEVKQLKKREQELSELYDSQTKMLEDLTHRYIDIETELQTAREHMENQEKEYKEKFNQLQLDFLGKLEISASEHRDNMKKYNKEWQDKKEEYEQTIEDLKEQIRQLELLTSANKEIHQQANRIGNVDGDNDALYNEEISTNDDEKKKLEEVKQSLERQLHMLQEQLDLVTEENNKYKHENPLLDSKIVALEEELKCALQNISILESEKDNWEAQVIELRDSLKSAQEINVDYDNVQKKLCNAELQIQELNAQYANREEIINNLENKLNKFEAMVGEVEFLQKKCTQLQDYLNSSQEKEQNILKENEDLKQEKSNLQQDCDELSACKSELLLTKGALEDQLQQITNEMNVQKTDSAILESQLRELKEENLNLQHKSSILLAEKCSLEEELKCRKEKEYNEESLEQVIKEKAEISQNLRLITENIESLQEQLKQKDEEIKIAKEEKNDIEKDLYSLRESLSKTIEEKHQQLLKTEKEKEKIRQDSIQTYHDIRDLRQFLAKANKEKEKKQKQNTSLKQDMKVLQDKLSLLSSEKSEQDLELENTRQSQKELESVKEFLTKLLSEKQQEFASLEESYRLVSNENQTLQTEVQDLQATLASFKQDKELLLKEIEKLRQQLLNAKDSLKQQLESFENIKEENDKLKATIINLNSLQNHALSALQNERDHLQNTVEQYRQQQREFQEKEETLKQKIETLSQQLHVLRFNTQAYEKLLLEHEEVENALTEANNVNQELQKKLNKLSLQQENDASTIKNLSGEIEILNLEQGKHLDEKRELEIKLSHLKATLLDETSRLKSSFDELQLKYDSMQTTNNHLKNLNSQLQEQVKAISDKLQEFNNLQKEFNSIKIKNIELQHKLNTTVEEASLSLRGEIEQCKFTIQKQQDDFNKIKNEMEAKCQLLEEKNQKLFSSITMLQGEKQTMEDKIKEITVQNFEQDMKRSGIDAISNTSIGSNTSFSPRGRQSLERANNSIEDKLSTTQQKNLTAERKNRRFSTHDERRRQSYWGVVYDKETMTDPVDTNCNCIELDRKLKENERNLFIKNSQVTVLNMQLKNHPLKDENAALIKRLQEEQDKHRIEVKRLKNRLYEQTAKTEKALAAAALATAKTAEAEVESVSSSQVIPKVLADAEAQTDGELSASLQKLQAKYNDLKNICRYRYNLIKELEEKLSHKENSNGNSLSALEQANYKALNNECESLKKELNAVMVKYEYAKKVLQLRRDEIQKLSAQQSQ